MIAAVNSWGVILALAIALPCCITLAFLGYLVHRDSQQEPVHFSMPRIIPWTAASRARHVRAEVELEQAKANLYDIRHKRLQKETVFRELENAMLDRAIGRGSDNA